MRKFGGEHREGGGIITFDFAPILVAIVLFVLIIVVHGSP